MRVTAYIDLKTHSEFYEWLKINSRWQYCAHRWYVQMYVNFHMPCPMQGKRTFYELSKISIVSSPTNLMHRQHLACQGWMLSSLVKLFTVLQLQSSSQGLFNVGCSKLKWKQHHTSIRLSPLLPSDLTITWPGWRLSTMSFCFKCFLPPGIQNNDAVLFLLHLTAYGSKKWSRFIGGWSRD